MPRRLRSYLPGGAFHITARTHWGEFWFEDLRSEIVQIIERALRQTDAILLAYVIMTNHLHLVIRQGIAPLSRLMHPVCQRTAYAVHRRCQRKGYVMGYRYSDIPCSDEAHLRNAIVYTHRNPVAAGMCSEASDYVWSSDRAYRSAAPEARRIATLQPANGLFGSGIADRTPQENYSDFYEWYDTCKRLAPDQQRPYSPGVTAGDEYWLEHFGETSALDRYRKTDLRDVILKTLRQQKPVLTLDELRCGGRSRSLVAIRVAVIEQALLADYQPASIARFLNISDSAVSRVSVALKRRLTT